MFVNKCEESQSDYSAQKSFLECALSQNTRFQGMDTKSQTVFQKGNKAKQRGGAHQVNFRKQASRTQGVWTGTQVQPKLFTLTPFCNLLVRHQLDLLFYKMSLQKIASLVCYIQAHSQLSTGECTPTSLFDSHQNQASLCTCWSCICCRYSDQKEITSVSVASLTNSNLFSKCRCHKAL